jgi:GNAT superfamily N-acetyltransferase
MPALIRNANESDAVAACDVLRRSITELCIADHRNDPAVLGPWLANKTPANVASWISRPANSLLVAVENEAIVAVGAVTDAGWINLNYVAPEARFRGISHALLGALEARAAARGSTACSLQSTGTARRFYLARGYIETGPPIEAAGHPTSYPMTKILVTA